MHTYSTRLKTRQQHAEEGPRGPDESTDSIARARTSTSDRRRRRQETSEGATAINKAKHHRGDQRGASKQEAVPSLASSPLKKGEHDFLLKFYYFYYDLDNVGSFTGSAKKLYNATRALRPTLTLKKCKYFLQTQAIHTLTKTPRTFIKRNKIQVYKCYEQLSIDIMTLKQYLDSPKNDYRYAYIIVDTMSRFIWSILLRTRTSSEIVPAFRRFLTQIKPKLIKCTIHSDQESAIIGRDFRAMIKDFDVELKLSFTSSKVSHSERAIRTLRSTLYKYVLYAHDVNLVSALECVIKLYNNSPHSALFGKSPAEIISSVDAEFELYEKIHPNLVEGRPHCAVRCTQIPHLWAHFAEF